MKKLAGTCEFTNDQLQDSLRDRFICGLCSEQIKRKLLSANYTFQEAFDAAIAQETAQKDVQTLGSNSLGLRSPAGVNKVRRDNLASRNRTYTTGRHNARNDKQMQPTGATQRCFRCGLTNHSPDKCKYKDFECHRCHQKGHLRSECRNTKPPRPKAEGRQHVRLADQDAAGEAPEGGEDQFFDSIFNLDGAQPSVSQNSGMATPAVKVPVLIEDTEFLMVVDTGAAASILSYSDYDRHFKYLALKPVQRSFHSYVGTPLDVAGQTLVDVEHNGQRATLPLPVVRAESYAPPLLGRSWLTKIRLDWSTLFSPPISQVSVDQDNDVRIERLKEQYREIFKPELGTVKGVKAKLYLKENAKPVFQRARPVPYALRLAIEEELKRMESDGVLKPIEVSDWPPQSSVFLKPMGLFVFAAIIRVTQQSKRSSSPSQRWKKYAAKCQLGINSQRLTCEVRISN